MCNASGKESGEGKPAVAAAAMASVQITSAM
jgi:hypothetical protein